MHELEKTHLTISNTIADVVCQRQARAVCPRVERGQLLAAAVADLKKENTRALSPLYQKMSDRYGTSGYSMGGGGSTQASASDSSLKVGIGMAAWSPTGRGVNVPTLLMCGDSDLIAGCSSNSEWAYGQISNSVPKMWVMIGATHLSWFGPGVEWGLGGAYGLAFAKLFLEGDQRWKPTLLGIGDGWVTTNRLLHMDSALTP